MAQVTYVGQGQHAILGPMAASIMILISLVFVLLGIKIWGFRRRLTFDPSSQNATHATPLSQFLSTSRGVAYEFQGNGTDNAVHGVFRQRSTEVFESFSPTGSTASQYHAGRFSNLRSHENQASISKAAESVYYRSQPQSTQNKRRGSFNHSGAPPTREPPAPPIGEAVEVESNMQLKIPNFDNFSEKNTQFSDGATCLDIKDTLIKSKESGRYLKYEQVDDVPELRAPDGDLVADLVAVAAVVHHVPTTIQEEIQLRSELPLQHTDSAYVVEIIAGTPDAIDQSNNNFGLAQHINNGEFVRIRSSYEMNEADILDSSLEIAGVEQHLELPAVPCSPPGFGKTIDDDWENFENLENVTELPEPNWSVHPAILNSPQEQRENDWDLKDVLQKNLLFQQLENLEPTTQVLQQPQTQPPPYRLPSLSVLPDYESLMKEESLMSEQKVPKYDNVVNDNRKHGSSHVSNKEDIFIEVTPSKKTNIGSPTPLAKQEHNIAEVCEHLDFPQSAAVPFRLPPQPAPRVSKSATSLVLGNTAFLNCYRTKERSSGCSSKVIAEEPPTSAPQPVKRRIRSLKVRFDVENLKYYDSEYEPQLPTPVQRSMVSQPTVLTTSDFHNAPRLFGTQVSQEDSDNDEAFDRVISRHRSLPSNN